MNKFQLSVFYLADLLTIEHHKPSPKPKKQERKLGDWYYQDGSVVKGTSNFLPQMSL